MGSLLVGAVVVAAAVTLVARGVSTSSGRVRASATTEGVLGAATLSLGRADESQSILLNASGLYPGRVERGCVVVTYDGSIPARLTLSGVRRAGSGLERYVDVQLVVLSEPDCALEGDAESTGHEVFSGTLAELWSETGSDVPATLAESIEPGHRLALVAIATLTDDNRAQGLTTDFEIVVEARPT